MLQITSVELKLISDIDMYLFFEMGMRGGISYIWQRYSKVRNKYVKLYDYSKPTKCITFLDANNLYSWTMSQYLPWSGLKLLNQEKIDGFGENSVSESSLHGYILEVVLEYPGKLHRLHNDYPLTSENLEIGFNILSRYCNDITHQYDINVGGVNKLVPNLDNKSKYVLQYRNFELYLPLGMKLKDIHSILKLKKSVGWKNTLI